MQHDHGDTQGEPGSMGHGGGIKGVLLMALCCIPMIVIVLVVVGAALR